MYDSNHKITRAGAEQAIREGGTVFVGGRLYGRVESLPPETEFAVGDSDATRRALEGLKATRAQLDEQERKLLEANARQEEARKQAAQAQKEREKREAENRKAADSAAASSPSASTKGRRGKKGQQGEALSSAAQTSDGGDAPSGDASEDAGDEANATGSEGQL